MDLSNLTTFLLRHPRNTEITPEAAKTFLAALTQINSVSFWQKLGGARPRPLALEIALTNQQIKFCVTCDRELAPFIQTQIQSNYPLVIIEATPDPALSLNQPLDISSLRLGLGSYYPIATFDRFKDVDPLSSILAVLSKKASDKVAIIQFALASAGASWQAAGVSYGERGIKNPDGTFAPRADYSVIKEKISQPGFKVSIRIAVSDPAIKNEITGAFGVFARADGNYLHPVKPSFLPRKSLPKISTCAKFRIIRS
jgi:hypothetical protein